MPPFKKVLIANRGEIAVRIARTCRDLGIAIVAVYSDPDRTAMHVRIADEAYRVGGATPHESYLNIESILEAARRSRADALHPGYGFLSENPALAEACERAGITFVGPSAGTLRRIGEKTSARSIVAAAGVPIVPGMTSGTESFEELQRFAQRIGHPLLIKACAGGGGKGMRQVDSEADLAAAFRATSSEARTAFGDGSVYLEQAILRPRHVEVQFLADGAGQIVCLGERDCSIQRRHQKLIEETPSPVVTPKLRSALFEAARVAAGAVDYVNAGTAEFLVDGHGRFYFLEVNARLQVEHPVTEEATGLDLVKEQLRIAAGGRLEPGRMAQPRRAALECRIYTEDPYNRFLPSAGTLTILRQPAGPGVRVESASYPGLAVGLHYDPMLAKLVTWGDTREEAINRMRRALQEYVVLGVKSTIPFHRFALEDEVFLDGSYDTSFVERWLAAEPQYEELLPVAALAAALLVARERRVAAPPSNHDAESSSWGTFARRAAMRWP